MNCEPGAMTTTSSVVEMVYPPVTMIEGVPKDLHGVKPNVEAAARQPTRDMLG